MTYPYGRPGQDPRQGGYPQNPYPGGPVYPPNPGYAHNPLTNARPGSATAAAVLAFVQAGITLCTTIVILFILASVPPTVHSGELTLDWLVTLAQAVGAGLLIYGGVQLIGGTGRTIYLVAAGIEVAISVYYLIRALNLDFGGTWPGTMDGRSGAAMIPILFAVLPVVGLCLALSGTATAWSRSKLR